VVVSRRRASSTQRYDRMERVNEVVQQVVAERLETLSDPRLELVTVTGAKVSADLSHATVYFAARGAGDAAVRDAEAGFAAATPLLRRAVGDEVRLRQTPKLRFVLDPAIVEGARIDEILRELRAADAPDVPEPEDGEP
jgi:ribosome-binding factor A